MARILIAHNFKDESFSAMSHRLAHLLSERHEVVFMSYRPYFAERLSLNQGRLTVYSWHSKARPTGFRDVFHFARIFLRHRPQVVVAHFVGANISILVSKILSGFGVRTYEWYHTQSYMIEYDHGRIHWLRRWRRRFYYGRFVDRVVAVSELSARDYKAFYGLDNCQVLLNGIRDRYRAVAMDTEPQVLTVGFLGRLEGVKGIEMLLEMIDRLSADDYRFKVAGEGPYSDRLAGLQRGNVEYLGLLHYGSVVDFIESCQVIVIPSVEDNLVTVGIEALMLERCLLISDRTGLSAYLKDGVDASIRPPEISAFIDALEDMRADRVAMQRMAVEGRATFLRMFSMESHLQNVERLIFDGDPQRDSKPRMTLT